MQTIILSEYREKYEWHYHNRTTMWALMVFGMPILLFLLPTIVVIPLNSNNIDQAAPAGAALAFWYLVLGEWYMVMRWRLARRHYLYFRQPVPLSIHTMTFSPALKGQQPVKITISFQWPTDFDVGYPKEDDAKIIQIYNPEPVLKAEVTAALNQLFDSFSRNDLSLRALADVYEGLTYSFVEESLLPRVREIAQTTHFSFVKYECANIVLPEIPKPEPEPDFGGVAISTANPPHVILDSVRNQHVYVPGKTRRGKSTLLQNMALQDIKRGKGVAVLDPKGDTADKLLRAIPRERADDCIFLDIANPVPIDVMSWESEEERQTLASDLQYTFLQFSQTKDGDRWLAVLQDTIHALIAAKDCTFLDIYHFLTDERKKADVLGRIRNPDIQKYWKEEFPKLPKDAATPILYRMRKFILIDPVKKMLERQDAALNMFDVMEEGKVLIVKLTGAGDDAANLIGQLITAKFLQASFRRQRQPEYMRKPFHFYADEFQRFQTSSFDTILSMAGGFQLCLTLANQFIGQIGNIFPAIDGNVGSYVCFQLGSEDAKRMKSKLGKDASDEVENLPVGKAVYRDADGDVQLIKTLPPIAANAGNEEYIRNRTLRIYGGESRHHEQADATITRDDPTPETNRKAFSNNPRKTSGAAGPR